MSLSKGLLVQWTLLKFLRSDTEDVIDVELRCLWSCTVKILKLPALAL